MIAIILNSMKALKCLLGKVNFYQVVAKDAIQHILEHLNSFELSIKFTHA